MIARYIILSAIFFCVVAPARPAQGTGTGELQKGIAAFEAKDYERAVAHLVPLAVGGNAEAQYTLSYMYFDGLGIPQDHCASTIWAYKAARQGHPYAALHLGLGYLGHNSGLKKNPELAYRWAVYADKQGHPKAHEDLDFIAKWLAPGQRAKIDRDMTKWSPDDAPSPELFVLYKVMLDTSNLSIQLHNRYGLSACN